MRDAISKSYDEESQFVQGDIIAPVGFDIEKELTDESLFVILTADCDIEQNKFGNFYSVLPIVSAHSYLNRIWGYAEVEKIQRRACEKALEHINKCLSVKRPDLQLFSSDSFCDLVYRVGYEKAIDISILHGHPKIDEISRHCKTIGLISKYDVQSRGYLELWAELVRQENAKINIRSQIEAALSPRSMRTEYFFLPSIRNHRSIGIVVLLREIRAISASKIFRNKVSARINNAEETSYVRIGRFSDQIRFAIAQRVATLFSRIGLVKEIEMEIELTCEIVAHDIDSMIQEGARK